VRTRKPEGSLEQTVGSPPLLLVGCLMNIWGVAEVDKDQVSVKAIQFAEKVQVRQPVRLLIVQARQVVRRAGPEERLKLIERPLDQSQ
jgi:hypothetical protein